jgi:hypothetical protein
MEAVTVQVIGAVQVARLLLAVAVAAAVLTQAQQQRFHL